MSPVLKGRAPPHRSRGRASTAEASKPSTLCMARMRYLWRAASATPLPWSSTLARWVWAGAKGPYLVFACRLEVSLCSMVAVLEAQYLLLSEGGDITVCKAQSWQVQPPEDGNASKRRWEVDGVNAGQEFISHVIQPSCAAHCYVRMTKPSRPPS
eukprot:1158386-Pelagomonas_calceolata.AAC.6